MIQNVMTTVSKMCFAQKVWHVMLLSPYNRWHNLHMCVGLHFQYNFVYIYYRAVQYIAIVNYVLGKNI